MASPPNSHRTRSMLNPSPPPWTQVHLPAIRPAKRDLGRSARTLGRTMRTCPRYAGTSAAASGEAAGEALLESLLAAFAGDRLVEAGPGAAALGVEAP